MIPDPALPTLTSEEQAELDLRRKRQTELWAITTPEEALQAKDELQRVHARIIELREKGRARTIKG